MLHFVLVAIGGATGAVARHSVNLAALRLMGPAFPWGTLAVNIAGSFAMGLFAGWLARWSNGASNELRLLVATGFLGGFTTFSAFSLDFANLWRDGETASAAIYVGASVMLSLAALFSGLWIVRLAG